MRAWIVTCALLCAACARRDDAGDLLPPAGDAPVTESPPPEAPPACPPTKEPPWPTREPGAVERQSDTRLIPVALGRSWTRTLESAHCGTISQVSLSWTFTEETTIDGRDAWTLATLDDGRPSSATVAFEGDAGELLLDPMGDWVVVLAGPVEEGASWMTTNGTGTWHRESDQTVAAGTFGDCWRVDYEQAGLPKQVDYEVFCRGVGVVRSEVLNEDGSWSREELVSKSW